MSAVESALDVLSRAATMVQGQFTPLRISVLRAILEIITDPDVSKDTSSFSRCPRTPLRLAEICPNFFSVVLHVFI